jgi:hypothetical protein
LEGYYSGNRLQAVLAPRHLLWLLRDRRPATLETSQIGRQQLKNLSGAANFSVGCGAE